MDLKHIVSQQRRRNLGPALDIDFVNYSEGRAQVGPSLIFTRASSGTFVNENGLIVGKTKTTTQFNPSSYIIGSVLTIDIPEGSIAGWINRSEVRVMEDIDGDDKVDVGTGMHLTGTIIHKTATTLSLNVTAKVGNALSNNWWVSYRGIRREHDPVTLRCRGLLMEENRTNLLLQSEDFDSSRWKATGANFTVTPDDIVSPSGAINADKLTVGSTTQAYQCLQDTPTLTLNTTYSASIFFKPKEIVRVMLTAGSHITLPLSAIFDLTGSGSVIGTPLGTASIQRYPNGWYRCVVTAKAAANAATTIRIYAISGTSTDYPGNGTDSFYAWGAQLEAGINATSYIPTTLTTVVRSGDVSRLPSVSGFYNNTGGTLVGQCSLNTSNARQEQEFIRFGFRDSGNRIQFGVTNTGGQAIRAFITNPFQTFGIYGTDENRGAFGTLSPGATLRKVAFAFAPNSAILSLNGTLSVEDPTVNLPTAANLDSTVSSAPSSTHEFGKYWDGIITNVQYYRQRLPNSKLQTLTTTSTQDLTLGVDSITYLNDQIRITI